jgi:hypothetical protein
MALPNYIKKPHISVTIMKFGKAMRPTNVRQAGEMNETSAAQASMRRPNSRARRQYPEGAMSFQLLSMSVETHALNLSAGP